MTDTKTFTTKQATAILNRAVAIQAKTRTLEELRETAAGAGVEMRWLEQAIAEAERPAWLVRAARMTWAVAITVARATWAGVLKPILRFGWRINHLAWPLVPVAVGLALWAHGWWSASLWPLFAPVSVLLAIGVLILESDYLLNLRNHPSKNW